MDRATENLSRYVKDKGISIMNLAKNLNMPYAALYDSLSNDKRSRDLRAGEFLAICNFLSLNPMDFKKEDEV